MPPREEFRTPPNPCRLEPGPTLAEGKSASAPPSHPMPLMAWQSRCFSTLETFAIYAMHSLQICKCHMRKGARARLSREPPPESRIRLERRRDRKNRSSLKLSHEQNSAIPRLQYCTATSNSAAASGIWNFCYTPFAKPTLLAVWEFSPAIARWLQRKDSLFSSEFYFLLKIKCYSVLSIGQLGFARSDHARRATKRSGYAHAHTH